MKKPALALAVGLLVATPLYASQCPSLAKKIEAALPTAQLDATTRAEVIQLWATGEEQHKNGSHSQSVKTLNEALEKLGAK